MATNKPIIVDEIFGTLTKAKEGSRWLVVYTKPKREKKLAEYAKKRKINYFLPLILSLRKYKYRKIQFTKPLFPGYIFVKCNFREKNLLQISGHILTFLKVIDEDSFLDELNQIYLGKTKAEEVEIHDYVEIGTRVEITEGSLKGLKGLVTDNEPNKIILSVNLLKRSIAVEIKPGTFKIVE